jgi:subtilisin family serine protease
MRTLLKRIGKRCLIVNLFLGFISMSLFAQGPDVYSRKIVVFQEWFVNEASQRALLKNFGAVVNKPLRLINGMAVYLPKQAEEVLLHRHEISRIDDDLVISASDKPVMELGKPKPSQPPQEIPWGIDRIEADLVWDRTTGLGVKVAVVDTGIDLDHPDLINNIKGNVNCINPRKSGDDDNGHGTHVAGIIGAVNNQIGVIGVGPEISLYAVKVLDKNGKGWLSDLIEGLEWCINNKMDIVNMSLGSSSDNQSFHDAIRKVYEAGIIQVAAAGNNGLTDGSIDYPAKYPETIAVSAVGQNSDGSLYPANFSSYGQEIDLTAPGVSIKSTYINGNYKTFDGTSMATPHVSGVAALTISVKGRMSPDELKTYLKNRAENLGLDPYKQGAGLIRADLSTQ